MLVLFAFNYKTINYCFKLSGNEIAISQDIDCGEEESKSEKSDEKNEKKEILECFFFNHPHAFISNNQQAIIQHSELLKATSDYSVPVFSPPEEAAI